jgi:hypothetical protein
MRSQISVVKQPVNHLESSSLIPLRRHMSNTSECHKTESLESPHITCILLTRVVVNIPRAPVINSGHLQLFANHIDPADGTSYRHCWVCITRINKYFVLFEWYEFFVNPVTAQLTSAVIKEALTAVSLRNSSIPYPSTHGGVSVGGTSSPYFRFLRRVRMAR